MLSVLTGGKYKKPYINISLSDIHLQSQLSVFIDVLFSYFTTCFGSTGPSSGESQYNTIRNPVYLNDQ
jgi:hypothetical protein